MQAEDKLNLLDRWYGLTPVPGFESLRLPITSRFPALWQHIEC